MREFGPTTGLAMLLGFAAHHDRERGPALAAEGLEVARATGDEVSIAWGLWFTRAVVDPRDHVRNWELLEQVLELARRHDIKDLLSFALVSMAERSAHEGKYTLTRRLHEEAHAVAKAYGGWMAIGTSTMFLALDHAAVHDPEPMVRYIDEALRAFRETDQWLFIATGLWQAAWGEYQNGLLDRSRDHAEESLLVIDPATWPDTAFAAHRVLARTYASLGQVERAREHVRLMRSLARSATRDITEFLSSGHVEWAAGELHEAERLFHAGLHETERPDAQLAFGYVRWDWFRALTQEALGEVLAARGLPDEASALLSAALAFYSDPLAWRRRAEIEAKLAGIRSQRSAPLAP